MANIYTVSQVNSYIKNMFTQDFMMNHIFIRGEVSNCKYHTSGHVYFTLKDTDGTIACVLFAGNKRGMSFMMKEGQSVVVEGTVSVYERDGKYQLYAKKITLDGVGKLYERFEKLKSELEEMGMFAEEYKKPIPRYAMRIGIVTAKTGAAIWDIRNIAKRRNPFVQLVLYPAQVQGEGAKESIVRGIETLDKKNFDVLIVGRGGGSIEDLWAFNEECVARAIFECNTPIISAVGHEVDVTIADYVADLRAPTPSAAAELAVFDYEAFEDRMKAYERTLKQLQRRKLDAMREQLTRYQVKLNGKNPENKIREQRHLLIEKEEHLKRAMEALIKEQRHELALYSQRLNALSPLTRLSKGYAFVCDSSNRPLTTIRGIESGDEIEVSLFDGEIQARVEDIKEKKQFFK